MTHHNVTIPDEVIRSIRKEYSAGGTTYQKLADKYGINSKSYVRDIVLRNVRKEVK